VLVHIATETVCTMVHIATYFIKRKQEEEDKKSSTPKMSFEFFKKTLKKVNNSYEVKHETY
jgi:hypothetical protein